MALAGYAARQRGSDALMFALAHLAARWLDEAIGPAALVITVWAMALHHWWGAPR